FVSSYFLPIYFQVVLGATPFMSGVDVLASILPQMLVTMAVGIIGEFVSASHLRLLFVIFNFCHCRHKLLIYTPLPSVQRLGYLLPFMLLSGVVNSVGNG